MEDTWSCKEGSGWRIRYIHVKKQFYKDLNTLRWTRHVEGMTECRPTVHKGIERQSDHMAKKGKTVNTMSG